MTNQEVCDYFDAFLSMREGKMKATLYNWALSAKEVRFLYEHPILFRLKGWIL